MKTRAQLLESYGDRSAYKYDGGRETELLTHLPKEDLMALVRFFVLKEPLPQDFPRELANELRRRQYLDEPGAFFGKEYVMWGHITNPTEEDESWREFGELYVGSQGRANWEQIIQELARTCLERSGEKSKEVEELASFVWMFLEQVQFGEGEQSPERKFAAWIEQQGSVSVPEGVKKMRQFEREPDVRSHPLLTLHHELARNRDFIRLLRPLR